MATGATEGEVSAKVADVAAQQMTRWQQRARWQQRYVADAEDDEVAAEAADAAEGEVPQQVQRRARWQQMQRGTSWQQVQLLDSFSIRLGLY